MVLDSAIIMLHAQSQLVLARTLDVCCTRTYIHVYTGIHVHVHVHVRISVINCQWFHDFPV